MEQYWLWTEDPPDSGIEDGTWAICKATSKEGYSDEVDDEVLQGRITEIIIDTTNYLSIGSIDDVYDDALTDDPKRIIKFLFDQDFYG
jgi:hypothetical protein